MTRCSPRTALLAAALCLLVVAPPAAFAAGAPADMAMMAHAMPNAAFTLRTGIAQGKMVYIGKGGDIDGKANPTLAVHEGDVVQITLVNGEGAEHDIVLPDFHAASQRVSSPGASSTLTFRAGDIGSFLYFCSIGGHREAGMQGTVKVEATAPQGSRSGRQHRARSVRPAARRRRARPNHDTLRTRGHRAYRPAGRQHDVCVLDLQRQGARADAARARRRLCHAQPEERPRQRDDAQHRPACGRRSGRRRGADPGGARRDQGLHLQGDAARAVRLPLRHADGGQPHLEAACTA